MDHPEPAPTAPSPPWTLFHTPARILLGGGALVLVLLGAQAAGLPSPAALLAGLGQGPAVNGLLAAAILFFLVGLGFAGFLWWLAARSFAMLRDPATTPERLGVMRELPMALPEGTVRAVLALIVGVVGLPMLLFSQALGLQDAVAGYVNGIIAGVFGYYFGARSNAVDGQANRRLGDALVGQQRTAEALRAENANLGEQATTAAAAGAIAGALTGALPGQLAAALDRLARHIGIGAALVESLGPALPPGLLPANAAAVLARARVVAEAARAYSAEATRSVPAEGGSADSLVDTPRQVVEATAGLTGRDSPFATMLRLAAGALPTLAGGPLAGVAVVLGLGWQAGSGAWRRWRAQALAAPHDPTLFDPGSITPTSAALRLDQAPVFARAFAGLRGEPGFAAGLLDIVLRDDAGTRLWAAHGVLFASPEEAEAGLAEFLRALLAEHAAGDVTAPGLAAIGVALAGASPALRPATAEPEAARALLAAANAGGGTTESRAAFEAMAMLVGLLREQKLDPLRGMAELTP